VIVFLELNIKHEEVCRGCTLGKYRKTSFLSSGSRTTSILDLVHSNVSSPMSLVSLGGYKYYAIFIDELSRKTWIYFMKTKDEVLK